MNKIVDTKAKISFQVPSEIREIDFRYPQGQQPIKKEHKDFRDFEKNKFF